MNKNRACLLLLLCCIALFFDPIRSVAEQNSPNPISGLSYEIMYPNNQKNKNLGYFDLSMQPGKEQKVVIKLYNSLPQKITTQIRLNGAKTNSIGKVEYGPNNLNNDDSLMLDFINIVKGPKKLIIPAKSSTEVEFTISVPNTATNGLIAGGIQLQPLDDSKSSDKKSKDLVVNEFAYLVGMLLRVGDTSEIKPKLELNKIYIGFKDAKSHLFVNLSNIHPVYVEGMTISVQVRKSNKQKILFEHQQKSMRMAPNTMIDAPIDLADKKMSAGKYTAQITVTADHGQKWSWIEDFKVTKPQANRIKEEAKGNSSSTSLWLWFVLLMGVFVSLLSALGYQRVRKKKWKIRMEPKKKKSKKKF
ncbi:hypothetical protein DOK67_0001464 [Enterococcus sp. DIV0212c]|uniref:DUF916 and DUF3324 domain-containing protein n=1 Tax=Enterococcus sp. DIV0212c TaxID=2230867 RepID=UPI001A9AD7C7|nr:DUF916 and DUF3324 domain-containing protein [Enterococcus sp. DIV0212c]MBO1354329.1 DUF916 and DUF3324 domain-containing protein [Enterococcus sp. DIV0212c]